MALHQNKANLYKEMLQFTIQPIMAKPNNQNLKRRPMGHRHRDLEVLLREKKVSPGVLLVLLVKQCPVVSTLLEMLPRQLAQAWSKAPKLLEVGWYQALRQWAVVLCLWDQVMVSSSHVAMQSINVAFML